MATSFFLQIVVSAAVNCRDTGTWDIARGLLVEASVELLLSKDRRTGGFPAPVVAELKVCLGRVFRCPIPSRRLGVNGIARSRQGEVVVFIF